MIKHPEYTLGTVHLQRMIQAAHQIKNHCRNTKDNRRCQLKSIKGIAALYDAKYQGGNTKQSSNAMGNGAD